MAETSPDRDQEIMSQLDQIKAKSQDPNTSEDEKAELRILREELLDELMDRNQEK
jgi:hypothetical protein